MIIRIYFNLVLIVLLFPQFSPAEDLDKVNVSDTHSVTIDKYTFSLPKKRCDLRERETSEKCGNKIMKRVSVWNM